jgi:GDP-L-fucose synthase
MTLNRIMPQIAAGHACTVRDVVKALLKIDNYKDAEVVFDASKPTMIPKRLIDASKARNQLGFQAKVSLEDGLARTVAWYRGALKAGSSA